MKRTISLLPLLGLLLLCGSLQAQTKIIAHRGYWKAPGAAQNSVASLYMAHELGAYGSEFDVNLTSDKRVVVNHDPTIDGYLIEQTPFALLRDLRLSNGEILPTLEQYLVHGKVCKGTQLILEIKAQATKQDEDCLTAKVVELVRAHQMEAQTEYISFSRNACSELRRLQPAASVSYLGGDLAPQAVKDSTWTGIDYNQTVFDKHPEWIKEAHRLGLTVNVWTVDKPDDMKRFIKEKADFLTTNHPAKALKLSR
ncbi:MAG: glycerophosphodiester phosphodiesterase [Tannerella sp.]|nr:glycerophosphodiester phosphodiesterase [Tannerella sp.]